MPGVSSKFCTGEFQLGMYDLLGNPSKLDAMKKGIYNRKAGKLLEDLLNTLKENETIIHVHTWTKSVIQCNLCYCG